MRVISDNYENEQEEIKIHNYTLIGFTPKLIVIFINFAQPKSLSRDFVRPEFITVEFKHPFYSESGASLEVKQKTVSNIPIQYTQKEEEEAASFEE